MKLSLVLGATIVVGFALWVLIGKITSVLGLAGTKAIPGPPGAPILGHLPQIPRQHSWFQFKEWADQYGPIYRLSFAGNPQVIVSSEKIANDLLRDRGNIYSSRARLPMAGDLLGQNLRPLLMPYNDRWRKGRRLMHSLLNVTVAATYQPIQLKESTRVVMDLIRSPENYERWFERYSGGLVLQLAYGQTVETGEEEMLKQILQVVHSLERVASPGTYLVDTFPVLMYLPKFLAPFKREAEQLHQREMGLFKQLLRDVQSRRESGDETPSFVRTWLDKRDQFGLSEDETAYVIGTLFEAGAGTTAAAMMSFVLAMVHHSEWQKKMQNELDSEVGESRLPTFDDMPRLPTVRALVKETLRWRPVTAGGFPHQLTQDDSYEGYFLPAGTNIHPNQWAIHRDPELYPDPESFRPERWLDDSWPTFRMPLTEYPTIQNFSSFGFGRRICPGQNLAANSLNVLVARIGWACEIKKLEGVDVPFYNYTRGFNVQPKPFPFSLTARSQERMKVLQEALKERK